MTDFFFFFFNLCFSFGFDSLRFGVFLFFFPPHIAKKDFCGGALARPRQDFVVLI